MTESRVLCKASPRLCEEYRKFQDNIVSESCMGEVWWKGDDGLPQRQPERTRDEYRD